MPETRFHAMPDGRRIAFRHSPASGPGSGPAIVFLPGYMSDMAGSKATALLAWAEAERRECLLLDYSGCGESGGDFADGTLARWAEEVLALIEAEVRGEVVLVGSSMGGWLMLLAAQQLGSKLVGLVGIAAAPDFTDWGYDDAQKAQLSNGETLFTENAYGYDPTPTHPGFWSDGQDRRQLESEIAIDCPVRLLHGQEDTDVPPKISLRLAEALRSQDVQVTLIKGGDHRLSRDSDIALLLRTVAALA
ncbi:alpha/beta fold hydrolase [Altererythrobacter sp. Root672]|uniref:alpha/beta fold hydrolase n=1 Tax=Altererythrobacter sp. Root672 TaxID=1736584 RepID=UPI0006F7507C|nr:alpha/beta hydrolase [Altererythrobacter sp. Root672]KRA80364.1 alpha/beta hydrolase [Altererythrobacter sp. Root672]